MDTLALPLIFFLMAYHPSAAIPIVVLMATAGGGYSRYDNWIIDLVRSYEIPAERVLVLTTKDIKSELAAVYWPKVGEDRPPENMKEFYGLVVVDAPEYPEAIPYRLLNFCFDALASGGLLLVTENRKVIIQARKP